MKIQSCLQNAMLRADFDSGIGAGVVYLRGKLGQAKSSMQANRNFSSLASGAGLSFVVFGSIVILSLYDSIPEFFGHIDFFPKSFTIFPIFSLGIGVIGTILVQWHHW